MSTELAYPSLSSSARIGDMTLKNRIVLAAMGSNYANDDGSCGERIKAYYENQARGGAALLTLETTSVAWPMGASMPNMVGFSEDRFIPDLQELTKRVQKHGAKIAAQLNHSGKTSQEDTVAGRPLWVPSPLKKGGLDMMALLTPQELGNFIKAAGPDGKGPRFHIMSLEDIQTVKAQFVDAAKRAVQSGFDAIEIHAGHGYLIATFLSPATNHREDAYGGSHENRARLLTEIIAEIKTAVGETFPIIVRIDAKEYRIENGVQPDDFLKTIALLEVAGADAINVSAYGNTSIGISFTEAPLVHQPAGFAEFARMAKRTVNIPIIAVGRIELDIAEKAISRNEFDFIAMGRKLLADPELPAKVVSNRPQDIRPCIYCYICVSQIFINHPMLCAVNPHLGQEHRDNLIACSTQKKHVLVIGAGPGGMEAARVAAERGHRVTLWEKDTVPGGTARIAALAYEPNGRLITWLYGQLQTLGVDINFGKTACLESVKSLGADQIIVATGASRRAPELKGKALKHVFDGEEMRGMLLGGNQDGMRKLPLYQRLLVSVAQKLQLLKNIDRVRLMSNIWMPIRKDLVIIGGGLVGLELAEFLVERKRQVVVLEPTPHLGPELSIVRRARVVHQLREDGAKLICNTEIMEITDDSVHYRCEGEDHTVRANQVIIALGAEKDTSLCESLQKAGLDAVAIGDCNEVGYIDGAIHSARAVANEL